MTLKLIRINDVTVSVANLQRIQLDQPTCTVNLFVNGRVNPFTFAEQSSEKATSLYLDLCKLVRSTQDSIPFFLFGTVTTRLDTLTAIHVERNTVVISTTPYLPEVISYSSDEAAKTAFDEAMKSLGISNESAEAQESEAIATDSPKSKKARRSKPPDKEPSTAAT